MRSRGCRRTAATTAHTLVTTLEPCCMCTGAIVQGTIRRVRFAGHDPYAGAARMPIGTAQALRRPLQVTGPLRGHYGWLAELLHMLWLLHHNASAPVLDAQRHGVPDAYAAAAAPRTRDLFARLARERVTVSEALSASAGLSAG
jgi:hypothetical protein